MAQLVQAALRAEKSLKGAKDQLKKQQVKLAKEAQKGQPQKTAETVALFDQGVQSAQQILRFSHDNVPAELDFSRPWVLSCAAWAGEALAACKAELDAFKVSFDIGRKDNKGIRASTSLDVTALQFDLRAKLMSALGDAHKAAFQDTAKMPMVRKQMEGVSVFGIDHGYDRVSTESAGLPCFRFTLEGCRKVVMTEGLQLLGYMQRKGVSGHISVARQAAFFRNLNAAALAEFVDQCSLYTTTLEAGDLLYLPFGAVQGELVHHVTYGWRLAAAISPKADKNMLTAIRTRQEDLNQIKQSSTAGDEAKTKAEVELELLKELA